MKRLGIFVTEQERKSLATEQDCSGMFLADGKPIGDPAGLVRTLAKQYGLDPTQVGLSLLSGEFVQLS